MGAKAQHLYFMFNAATGLVKIGVSQDLEGRRRELERAGGTPLTILGWLHDGSRYEDQLHLAFHDDRQLGEWFTGTGEILALAMSPESVPRFVRSRARQIKAARELRAAVVKAAGSSWRAVALRRGNAA